MQVVLLGQILRIEIVLEIGRRAVAVALLRGLGDLVREAVLVELAAVGKIIVGVRMSVSIITFQHGKQPEEPVEHVVKGLLVAAVLDQTHLESRAEQFTVAEDLRCGSRGHRVHGLGHADTDSVQS
jgi:hypothetical protein